MKYKSWHEILDIMMNCTSNDCEIIRLLDISSKSVKFALKQKNGDLEMVHGSSLKSLRNNCFIEPVGDGFKLRQDYFERFKENVQNGMVAD